MRTSSRNRSDKPEPLGRATHPPEQYRPANYRPSLRESTPYPLDAYPFGATPRERDQLRAEDDFRARELADLPDPWTEEELMEAESLWKQWQDELSRS